MMMYCFPLTFKKPRLSVLEEITVKTVNGEGDIPRYSLILRV